MWYNNRLVVSVYANVTPRYANAVIEGIAGWRRIAPVSSDGDTNVLDILKVAKANGRRVHVYINADHQIYAAVLL